MKVFAPTPVSSLARFSLDILLYSREIFSFHLLKHILRETYYILHVTHLHKTYFMYIHVCPPLGTSCYHLLTTLDGAAVYKLTYISKNLFLTMNNYIYAVVFS